MATTGPIVDVDDFGDSDPSTPSPMLSYSAVLHPLVAPVVSGAANAQEPRSRRAATHFNGLQTTHTYSRRAPYVPLWAACGFCWIGRVPLWDSTSWSANSM